MIPEKLYHYYDRSRGPFLSLSSLDQDRAEQLQNEILQWNGFFASQRSADYIRIRFELEDIVRTKFIQRGGKPERLHPLTMTLGACDWLQGWYPNPECLSIQLSRVDPRQINFTYGDIFPAFQLDDGQEHNKQVYLRSELESLISRFGLPQKVNANGERGPKRYIEAQIWSEEFIPKSIQ